MSNCEVYFFYSDLGIDECSINNGGCSSNAGCMNLPASFSCTCNLGYTGNGFNCTGNKIHVVLSSVIWYSEQKLDILFCVISLKLVGCLIELSAKGKNNNSLWKQSSQSQREIEFSFVITCYDYHVLIKLFSDLIIFFYLTSPSCVFQCIFFEFSKYAGSSMNNNCWTKIEVSTKTNRLDTLETDRLFW